MSILNKIKEHYSQHLPFVAYRKPNEQLVSAFFQRSDKLFFAANYQESGFVFAPFDDDKSSVLIPASESEFIQDAIDLSGDFSSGAFSHPLDEQQKQQHIQLVKKGIKAIEQHQFKKVVLSRRAEVELTNFKVIETFQRLLAIYPNAFVYVWFHPKVGLWLGATPETLVKINGNDFETMALAGTQTYSGTLNIQWQSKEIEEQQFVTDFIVENVQPICEKLKTSNVKTIKAGSLVHLHTQITGKLKTQNVELITKLHPTPAVCGLPREVSKEFIIKNEPYHREFYTGFLGELNVSTSKFQGLEAKGFHSQLPTSSLYVNLRCMQVKGNKVYLYVGGGITKDSNAEKEWSETVAKSKVMLAVLKS